LGGTTSPGRSPSWATNPKIGMVNKMGWGELTNALVLAQLYRSDAKFLTGGKAIAQRAEGNGLVMTKTKEQKRPHSGGRKLCRKGD